MDGNNSASVFLFLSVTPLDLECDWRALNFDSGRGSLLFKLI